MKPPINLIIVVFILLTFGLPGQAKNKQEVIRLYPENPNYFFFKGKPTILVTSGEHYGAVMNTAFDFEEYLNTLKSEGFNYTRIFIGPYCEIGNDLFGITNNTMNPKPENWLNPWEKEASSSKYDLTKWNEAFFKRLKAFMHKASENGIVVEVTFFTSYYTSHQWSVSPFNPQNNIQGFEAISFNQVNTTKNGQLMNIQEQYVRRMVRELNAFGNFFFEVQNEPWSDNTQLVEKIVETDSLTHKQTWQSVVDIAKQESLDWQRKITGFVVDEENQLPNKHLIAQNISNHRFRIENPDPNVSIFNFHYAYPTAATQNLGLNKVIALDETGFMPHLDYNYRSQAWKFLLAGGALYNNLDYSFTVGHEDGNFAIDDKTPGWGGVAFRKQLKIMKDFITGFDFVRMKPANQILKVKSGKLKAYQVLAETGKQYAIYIDKGSLSKIQLEIPDGTYMAVWFDPITGNTVRTEKLVSDNHSADMACPEFQEDVVLKILSR
jgi:hypothetical protein